MDGRRKTSVGGPPSSVVDVGGPPARRNHKEITMHKPGKKYREQAAKVEKEKNYPPQEAVALAKATSYAKFNATVEVHVRLGVDPKHADQNVRDVVVLPHGLGKTVRVLVFAEGDGARVAAENGADVVADDEVVKKIQE